MKNFTPKERRQILCNLGIIALLFIAAFLLTGMLPGDRFF